MKHSVVLIVLGVFSISAMEREYLGKITTMVSNETNKDWVIYSTNTKRFYPVKAQTGYYISELLRNIAPVREHFYVAPKEAPLEQLDKYLDFNYHVYMPVDGIVRYEACLSPGGYLQAGQAGIHKQDFIIRALLKLDDLLEKLKFSSLVLERSPLEKSIEAVARNIMARKNSLTQVPEGMRDAVEARVRELRVNQWQADLHSNDAGKQWLAIRRLCSQGITK